jgi:glycosyltransferase involved in cell wall biosynthesis
MNVTFVLPMYPWQPVGGFRVVYEYANGLAARGHGVSVIHPRRIRGVGRPPAEGFRKKALRPLGDLRFAFRQWTTRPDLWWQDIHPDVDLRYVTTPAPAVFPDADAVFATAWQTVPYVEALPGTKGTKCYLVMDFPPYLGAPAHIEDTWRRPLLKVAISSWLEERVREAGGADVRTVSIGVGDEFHRPAAPPTSKPTRAPASVVMMCSRAPYKAWEDGLAALRSARERVSPLQADLYGPGPAPTGLEPWVRYHRNVPGAELVSLFDRAAVVLCSSLAEGFALPPAEAALRGCAIVTTDCGGNRDYAVDGETALVSRPGEPAALAESLVRVLEDPELRDRLAAAARARLATFTWDRATAELEAVLARRVRGVDAANG